MRYSYIEMFIMSLAHTCRNTLQASKGWGSELAEIEVLPNLVEQYSATCRTSRSRCL